MFLSKLKPLAVLTLVLSAAAVSPLNASIVYQFTGACTDCFGGMGNATATLSLVDTYVSGNSINLSDVISFTYDATDLFGPYTIDQSTITFVSGSMPTTTGFADFFIGAQPCPVCQGIQFQSFLSDGTWATGLNGQQSTDMGTQGTWQAAAVPEPSAFVLIGGGLSGLAFLRRRRAMAQR